MPLYSLSSYTSQNRLQMPNMAHRSNGRNVLTGFSLLDFPYRNLRVDTRVEKIWLGIQRGAIRSYGASRITNPPREPCPGYHSMPLVRSIGETDRAAASCIIVSTRGRRRPRSSIETSLRCSEARAATLAWERPALFRQRERFLPNLTATSEEGLRRSGVMAVGAGRDSLAAVTQSHSGSSPAS